jgi:hypothetical protein
VPPRTAAEERPELSVEGLRDAYDDVQASAVHGGTCCCDVLSGWRHIPGDCAGRANRDVGDGVLDVDGRHDLQPVLTLGLVVAHRPADQQSMP